MTKIVERWLLYKYVGLEFTPLSKPFKTREQAEKAREKYPERLHKTWTRCDPDKEIEYAIGTQAVACSRVRAIPFRPGSDGDAAGLWHELEGYRRVLRGCHQDPCRGTPQAEGSINALFNGSQTVRGYADMAGKKGPPSRQYCRPSLPLSTHVWVATTRNAKVPHPARLPDLACRLSHSSLSMQAISQKLPNDSNPEAIRLVKAVSQAPLQI